MKSLCRTGITLALLCSTAFAADPVQITTEEQKLSYAVGVLFGRNMSLEVDVDNDAFLQGVRDVLEGQQLKLAPEEMRDVVQRFQDGSAALLQCARRAVSGGLEMLLPDALKHSEDVYLNQLMATEDVEEGLQAVLAKRKPVWKDR